MEGATLLYPPRRDISMRPLSDAETDDRSNVKLRQRETKNMEPTDLYEEVRMLRKVNLRLVQEKEELIVNLEECKSDLFKQIPPTQISDDSIQKALERIRGSIDGFVYETMRDVADDALYDFCLKKRKKRKHKRGRSQDQIISFIMRQDVSAWGPYECSNFYILSVIIQWFLDENVFNQHYPMGITKEQIGVLKEVERGMRQAGQTQKQGRFDIWRSETLKSLTAMRENKFNLEAASKEICNRLSSILTPWLFEAGPFDKVEEAFRQAILVPAMELHQDLKSSSHQYKMDYIKDFDGLSRKQMLDEWDLKDADTWQKPRGEKEVGQALHCLHPAIFRLRATGAVPVTVAKPVIVIKGPERERVSELRGLKDGGGLSDISMVPVVKIEPSPAADHDVSLYHQERSPRISLTDQAPKFTDSDSNTDSKNERLYPQRRVSTYPPIDPKSRQLSPYRKVSTYPTTQKDEYLPDSYPRARKFSEPHPTTQKHEHIFEPPQRRLSLAVESSSSSPPTEDHHRPRHPRFHLDDDDDDDGERLPSSFGRPEEEEEDDRGSVRPYTRGHFIKGSSYSHQSQAAIRQPSRRPSKAGPSSPQRSPLERTPSQPPPPPPPSPARSSSSSGTQFGRFIKGKLLGHQ